MRQSLLGYIVLVSVSIIGCHRELTIEDQLVKDIEISHPEDYRVPDKRAASSKMNSVLGADKVYKVDAKRYYNTVIPQGAVEISVDQAETRFYVRDMSSSDIRAFLDKYFPYQKKIYQKGDKRFVVEGKLMAQYADDSIVPQLDSNIIKPTAESVIEITVFWNQNMGYFEWKYTDPMERVRAAEGEKAIQEIVNHRRMELEREQKVMPSYDSPGNMINADISEIR